MDWHTTLPQSLDHVFGCLTTPLLLGSWLPEVLKVEAAPALVPGLGAVFTLILHADGKECAADGEMIAYEPPWLAAYRLLAGETTHLLRLTCATCAGGTRVQIHQGRGAHPLRIDLDRLQQALAADVWQDLHALGPEGGERTTFAL